MQNSVFEFMTCKTHFVFGKLYFLEIYRNDRKTQILAIIIIN